MAAGRRWSRDELLVALNLYHKLSFGQFHARNPVIVAISRRLARTPDSVAMKLCNFASLDPVLKLRGICGLEGASELDREMWADFSARPDEVVPESEQALRSMLGASGDDEVQIVQNEGIQFSKLNSPSPTAGVDVASEVRVRRGQHYFREVILNQFDNRCCVTGNPVRALLIASHILPWATHPAQRLDATNGLCLSRLHDAAFDAGLIALDDAYRLLLSRQLKRQFTNTVLQASFGAFESQRVSLPGEAQPPSRDYLRHHRENVFAP